MGKFAVIKSGDYPPGLPHGALSEALGFTGPDDVLVVIRKEPLGEGEIGPPLAHGKLSLADDYVLSPGVKAIPSLATTSDLKSDALDVSTLQPQATTRDESPAAAMPASVEEIERDRAARRLTEMSSAQQQRIPWLPERGVTFGQVGWVARALGAQAALLPGSGVRLESPFGEQDYATVGRAAAALNARSFKPGDR